ncbi:MAG: PLP-dependent aminotransferase family protein [Bacillota bacterium]|nr:PLP-dependent aminotransferase family protein [Bacillota bacterium]
MNSKFSKRTNNVKASETREILKVTERPEIISFAGGLPAPELFPVETLKEACEIVLKEMGQSALQYATTEGFNPLRNIIIDRMKALDIEASLENILVTAGSQQGLDLVGKLFIDEGDTIICESPTYLAAINAFKVYDAKFAEVAMDDDGMIMEELEKTLINNPKAKFIYTIPDFQNPTGRTMSLERRKRLIELANQYDVLIVEDNPYGAVRFAGQDLPPVKAFDKEGRVIYLSTFSKIFCPGLRLGWMCANAEFTEKFVAFKQSADLHTNVFAQMITAKHIELHDLEEHVKEIKAVYLHRRGLMLKCIKEEFPEGLKYTSPEGGLFIWVELPSHIDSKELFSKCLENNVAFVPGHPFFPNGGCTNTFRLNYSNMPDEKIIEGIKRLGTAIKSMM